MTTTAERIVLTSFNAAQAEETAIKEVSMVAIEEDLLGTEKAYCFEDGSRLVLRGTDYLWDYAE